MHLQKCLTFGVHIKVHWDILFAKCYDVANNMLKESKPDVEIDTYSKDILREIRTARISLDDLQKQEAKHLFGDNYQRYFIGRVIIAENGAKLDTVGFYNLTNCFSLFI